VERGQFYGMGYIAPGFQPDDLHQLKSQLTPYPGNDYIRNMVMNYGEKFPDRMVVFS
jgi:DNA polymerase-3 subunit epsilon